MTTRTEPRPTLFTIGHSNHELDDFVNLLGMHGVTMLADVRSHPYSRVHPQFNREILQTALERAGVQYVFLGTELGARRAETECYEDGKAKYDRIARIEAFARGLARLREDSRHVRIAIMCAEKDPLTCHRMILVYRAMRNDPVSIQHILYDGSAESMTAAEDRLLGIVGLPSEDLFRSKEELLEEAYCKQGDRIAYVETEHAHDPATV